MCRSLSRLFVGLVCITSVSVNSFTFLLTRRSLTRHFSSADGFEELIARSQAKIAAAESELASSDKMRKANPEGNEPRVEPSESDGLTLPRVKDDGAAFLIEMKKKLEDEDFKRIFDNKRVRGLYSSNTGLLDI